jgi:hypothetical protein
MHQSARYKKECYSNNLKSAMNVTETFLVKQKKLLTCHSSSSLAPFHTHQPFLILLLLHIDILILLVQFTLIPTHFNQTISEGNRIINNNKNQTSNQIENDRGIHFRGIPYCGCADRGTPATKTYQTQAKSSNQRFRELKSEI